MVNNSPIEMAQPKRLGRPKTLPLFHGAVPAQEAVVVLPYHQTQQVVDQEQVGKVEKVITAMQEAEAADKQIAAIFAGSEHPITKTQRVVVWFLKLEELGLQGNVKAFEILLDRAFGKVTETIAVAHGEFEGMKDAELFKQLQRIKGPKN